MAKSSLSTRLDRVVRSTSKPETPEFESKPRIADPRTLKTLPAQLHACTADHLTAEQFRPVRNGEYGKKPDVKTGLWTSTYTPDAEDLSDWLRWCRVDSKWTYPLRFVLEPEPDLKILVVDTMKDLEKIVARYQGGYGGWVSSFTARLDFEQMLADGYDGMHLTEEGQWRTRLTEPNLYGWDCESTIWFRWVFKSVKSLD